MEYYFEFIDIFLLLMPSFKSVCHMAFSVMGNGVVASIGMNQGN